MNEKKAIIDNSVLRGLYHLGLLDHLKGLYSEVLLPKQIEHEFLSINDITERDKRFNFLYSFIFQNSSWFRQCNFYKDDLVSIFINENKKLDTGEAGVFIQNQVLGLSHTLLIDEREARNYAKIKQINIHGILYLLAALDIVFGKCKYYDSVEILKKKHNSRFSEDIVFDVYENFKLNHLEF